MDELRIFENPEFGSIRTVERNGEPWFVGKDVAVILGYSNASKALADHVDEEDKLNNESLSSLGQRGGWLINESGLYSLVLSSKLPTAKKFKRWVTSEVLPSIRKHGAYMTPEKLEAAILNPDVMIQLCQNLKAEQEKNKQLQVENAALVVDKQTMQPKADYFDQLVDRNLLTNFRDTAKQLGIKPRTFTQWLVDQKYLFRDKHGALKPYENKNNGLFEMKEFYNDKTDFTSTQTLVTPKGRETFRLLCEGI